MAFEVHSELTVQALAAEIVALQRGPAAGYSSEVTAALQPFRAALANRANDVHCVQSGYQMCADALARFIAP